MVSLGTGQARTNYNLPDSSEKRYRADETPHPLQGIETKEKLGDKIDLNLIFQNEKAESKSLKSYFKEDRPVLMTVVYYRCPSLCNFHLNGLWTALNQLKRKNYEFVVLSMDATETPDLAYEKKQNYLKEFPKVSGDRVHFLTGSESAIQSLTEDLGFSFRWDEETKQFAHAPVAYTLSSSGVLSRYLYGVEFLSQTLKLALLEASRGKIGSVIDRVLLFCYRFNPQSNKYSIYAVNIMRAGGLLMLLFIISLLVPVWIKKKEVLLNSSL